MLNSTNLSTKISFNQPATGIIQKSTAKSFFVRMHQKSDLASEIFGDNGKYRGKRIIILQVLLTHESWFLVEIVWEKDVLEAKHGEA